MLDHKRSNRFQLSHLFLTISVVALIVGLWRVQSDAAKLREQCDLLRSELAEARITHIPHTIDPVAQAIRIVAAGPAKHQNILPVLISQWGELKGSKATMNPGTSNQREVRVLHSYPHSSAAQNSTIALLLDSDGKLIDAITYDSDMSSECHTLRFGKMDTETKEQSPLVQVGDRHCIELSGYLRKANAPIGNPNLMNGNFNINFNMIPVAFRLRWFVTEEGFVEEPLTYKGRP